MYYYKIITCTGLYICYILLRNIIGEYIIYILSVSLFVFISLVSLSIKYWKNIIIYNNIFAQRHYYCDKTTFSGIK